MPWEHKLRTLMSKKQEPATDSGEIYVFLDSVYLALPGGVMLVQ